MGRHSGGFSWAADDQEVSPERGRDGKVGKRLPYGFDWLVTVVPFADQNLAETSGDECLAAVGDVEVHHGRVGVCRSELVGHGVRQRGLYKCDEDLGQQGVQMEHDCESVPEVVEGGLEAAKIAPRW